MRGEGCLGPERLPPEPEPGSRPMYSRCCPQCRVQAQIGQEANPKRPEGILVGAGKTKQSPFNVTRLKFDLELAEFSFRD